MRRNYQILLTMSSFYRTSILIVFIFFFCFICKAQSDSIVETITVTPVSNNDFLINPGKGWVVYTDFRNANSSVWEKASVGYTRFNWKDIHIAENTFNWTPIDNALNECIARGKFFAFGVMCCNITSSNNCSSMPQWVIDAGAQFIYASGAPRCKVPVWSDSVFHSKIRQFINALCLRYNGNKNIAFIDNRTYGNWGEWHLQHIGGADPGDSIKNLFVDMYSVFDKTFIIQPNSNGTGSYEGGFAYYARDKYNMGWREDSSDEKWTVCASSSEFAPNVAEWSTSYSGLKAGAGWTRKHWTDQMVSEAISGSRYSYHNLGQWNGADANTFLAEKEYLVNEWQNKMGYWFKITSASFPSDLANGTNGVITFSVKNDGVARQCVKNSTGCVKLALMDNENNVMYTLRLSGINPVNWAPTETTHENAGFSFPFTPGATKLALGVFSDSTLTTPDTKLGINNGTPDNWYVLSDMVNEFGENINSPIFIYPNPVDDIVRIGSKNDNKFTGLDIYNINGSLVFSQSDIFETTQLDISELPSGVYFFKVYSLSKIFEARFVKK